MTVTQHTLRHSTATSKLTIPCRVAIAQRRVDIITVALTHQSSIAVYNNFRDYFSSLFCTRRHTHTLESAIGQFHICNIIFRIFFSSLIFRPLAAKRIAVSTPNGLRWMDCYCRCSVHCWWPMYSFALHSPTSITHRIHPLWLFSRTT